MSRGPFGAHANDLAAGEEGVAQADWSGFSIDDVRTASDPLFEQAWRRLWSEFGARGEMERREIIASRLEWNPATPVEGLALLYELIVVRRGGGIVAVRDHTAIVAGSEVVVHLSHVLVEPALRGSGLASWLRAIPVETARRCAAAAGLRSPLAITLVAEMEPDNGLDPAAAQRLRSYAKGGYLLADPGSVRYCQPDFRSAAEIELDAPRPLPLWLLLRRIDCAKERAADAADRLHLADSGEPRQIAEAAEPRRTIDAAELRRTIGALHAMFAVHVRADHMAAARAGVSIRGSEVALLTPAAAAERKGAAP